MVRRATTYAKSSNYPTDRVVLFGVVLCFLFVFADLYFLPQCGSCFHRLHLSFIVLALSSLFLFHVTISYPKVKCPITETRPIACTSYDSTVFILPSTSFYFKLFSFVLTLQCWNDIYQWLCTVVHSTVTGPLWHLYYFSASTGLRMENRSIYCLIQG